MRLARGNWCPRSCACRQRLGAPAKPCIECELRALARQLLSRPRFWSTLPPPPFRRKEARWLFDAYDAISPDPGRTPRCRLGLLLAGAPSSPATNLLAAGACSLPARWHRAALEGAGVCATHHRKPPDPLTPFDFRTGRGLFRAKSSDTAPVAGFIRSGMRLRYPLNRARRHGRGSGW